MTCVVQWPLTLAARALTRPVLAALVAGALLVPASAARATDTPEQICQEGRYSAAAQYSACQQEALAKYFGGGFVRRLQVDFDKFEAALAKCQTKYAAVWPKLRKKARGSACDTDRFTDNGTTVTDNLTKLQWEKKVSDGATGTLHGTETPYTWSLTDPAHPEGTGAADGTAFTTFLSTLNSGACFAGQCDWRLPTISELQTILQGPYPSATSPCIDPIFGPTFAGVYWSATTYALFPEEAWFVQFNDGLVDFGGTGSYLLVRAVRGGL